MKGSEFGEKRLFIEAHFEKVAFFLDKKEVSKARKEWKISQRLLAELSDKVHQNEIQERSIFNMNICLQHLASRID